MRAEYAERIRYAGQRKDECEEPAMVMLDLTALIARLIELEYQVREMSRQNADDIFNAKPQQDRE